MKKTILLLFLSVSLNLTAQKYSKRDQLNFAIHWLDYHFESNYSNIKLDPYSHKISLTTTNNGYKQYYDNIYLDIIDEGNSWRGIINMNKAVWKSSENYSSDSKQIEFNSNGYMTKYIDINSYNKEFDAKFYSGNNYSKEQTHTMRYEGNLKLEEPYRIFLKRKDYDSKKFYFINFDFNNNEYGIYDQNEQQLMSLDLVEDKPSGSFDYSLYGIRKVGTYRVGELDGDYVKYDINGRKILEGKYKKGYKIGTWTEFTSDSELYSLVSDLCDDSELNFIEVLDDEKHFNEFNYNSEEYIMGLVEMRYKTGEKLGSYYFNGVDNIVYGKFELFYKNGTIFCSGEYSQNGDLKSLELFTSKSYLSLYDFKKLFKNGEMKHYVDGKLKQTQMFKNYKMNGNYIAYYPSGKIRRKRVFISDKREGQSFWFYENGQIKMEQNFINDKLNGKFYSFYENGQTKKIFNYKNDLEEGEWLIYNQDGSILEKSNWKNGELVKD